jgi:Bacterial pre-peptidase C-terminal domain
LGDTAGRLYSTGAYQLTVQAMPVDTDDALFEAPYIGQVSRNPRIAYGQITWDVDVDMYAFGVTAGPSIDIDLDTPINGPGGLGSYLRIFNSAGQGFAANNDGAAPGESLGFDSFIRYSFSQGGTYFVGVSNWLNTNYNPITGNNDAPSWQHALGSYTLASETLHKP